MVTYLTGHFENTKVCDALIREWEADCTKEENGAWIEKTKEDKRSNSGNHSRSKIRSETRNIDTKRDKNKSTERILLPPRNNQNKSTRNNTTYNREKYDQKKRDIFPKNRSTSENFEIIVIATEGNNRNVRIIKQGDNEVHIIPETELQSKRRR